MRAYVTSTGAFLPGPPVSNDEMEDILGLVHGKKSRLKRRILEANGITSRHYAMDADHKTQYSVTDMGVRAGQDCLERSVLEPSQIGMLAVASTQGDLPAPGLGSMVQAGLDIPGVELLTTHGICSASAMAWKAAFNTIRVGDQDSALLVVSEMPSRLFKNTRYEAVRSDKAVDFNAEFLRWMLSDGAGALLMESKPRGQCLRVDWIRSFSYADAYPVCMSIGLPGEPVGDETWQDYPTYGEAEAHGALLIRQDVRLLENIVKLGVDGFLRLVEEGVVTAAGIDHLLCHYSSHHFKGKIQDMLEMSGASVPEERWFSNLYTRGNTGAASILIMLDEFLRTREMNVGDTVLCMVPESGRFNTAYIHLTMVEE